MWVDEMQKILHQVGEAPKNAQIEVNNACNLSCSMCPRLDLPVELKEMPFEEYKTHLNQLKAFGLEEIDLGGWGELSFHKQFIEILKYATGLGFKVSFTTNGLLMKGEIRQGFLDSGVKHITFSIDSLEKRKKGFTGHINSPAIQNLLALLSVKKEYGLNIKVNTLIQKINAHEIMEMIEFFDQSKVDMHVLFGPNQARDTEKLRLDYEDELKLYAEIDACIQAKKWNMVVTTPPRRYKGGKRQFHYLNGERCPQTWQSIYLNRKGEITPCTLLPDLSFGHLSQFQSLEEIWNSTQYKHFRRNQKEICAGCDALKFERH